MMTMTFESSDHPVRRASRTPSNSSRRHPRASLRPSVPLGSSSEACVTQAVAHDMKERTPASEAELLLRLKAGENAAYDELLRHAGGRMLAVARRMLRREQDAEDAVQEALVSAMNAINRFDGQSLLTTWLHRITVNACLMKLRSRRRRPERTIGEFLPEFFEDGHAKTPARPWISFQEHDKESTEIRELIHAKIDELPEDYREVLILRDVGGLDTDATARATGLTHACVKTRLHRARQALRTLLEPHFVERTGQEDALTASPSSR